MIDDPCFLKKVSDYIGHPCEFIKSLSSSSALVCCSGDMFLMRFFHDQHKVVSSLYVLESLSVIPECRFSVPSVILKDLDSFPNHSLLSWLSGNSLKPSDLPLIVNPLGSLLGFIESAPFTKHGLIDVFDFFYSMIVVTLSGCNEFDTLLRDGITLYTETAKTLKYAISKSSLFV